jgi:hypothetical protein
LAAASAAIRALRWPRPGRQNASRRERPPRLNRRHAATFYRSQPDLWPDGSAARVSDHARGMTSSRQLRPLSRIAAAARRLLPARDGLHRCPACRRDFACPIDWETDGSRHWLIRLRCGACSVWREVRASNAEAKDFDLLLAAQTAQMRRALVRFDRERMEAEIDAFVAALEHDLIDATDFAR